MSDETDTREDRYADVDTSHLENVADGCGCTEIWEHTSDREGRPEEAPPNERAVDTASHQEGTDETDGTDEPSEEVADAASSE